MTRKTFSLLLAGLFVFSACNLNPWAEPDRADTNPEPDTVVDDMKEAHKSKDALTDDKDDEAAEDDSDSTEEDATDADADLSEAETAAAALEEVEDQLDTIQDLQESLDDMPFGDEL